MNRTLNTVLAVLLTLICVWSFWATVSTSALYYQPQTTMTLLLFVVAAIALVTVLYYRPEGRIERFMKQLVAAL